VPLGAPSLAAAPAAPWQQAYDSHTGQYYYFNMALQVTQWEPPAEGYRPCMLDSAAIEQQMIQKLQEQEQPGSSSEAGGAAAARAAEAADQALSGSPPKRAAPKPKLARNAGTHTGETTGDCASSSSNVSHGGGARGKGGGAGRAAEGEEADEEPSLHGHHGKVWEEGMRVTLDPGTAAHVRTLLPRPLSKYWLQRYSLFSKYDAGVQMDNEGWWSVTPEVLALHQAKMCQKYSGSSYIAMDAMAGCGGNVIQMAMVFQQVIALELSKRRCDMIAHNVGIYEVGRRVELMCCDFFAAAPRLVSDVIFVSPPWGGPKYQYCETFEVLSSPAEGMCTIRDLVSTCLEVVGRTARMRGSARLANGAAANGSAIAHADGCEGPQHSRCGDAGHGSAGASTRGVVALFLPRNTDLQQLAGLVPEGMVWHAERNVVNGKLKGLTAYCFAS